MHTLPRISTKVVRVEDVYKPYLAFDLLGSLLTAFHFDLSQATPDYDLAGCYALLTKTCQKEFRPSVPSSSHVIYLLGHAISQLGPKVNA